MRTLAGKKFRLEIEEITVNGKKLDTISIHEYDTPFGCCISIEEGSNVIGINSGISGSEYSALTIKREEVYLFLEALNFSRHIVVDDRMIGDEREKSLREEKAENITFFIDVLDIISKFFLKTENATK